MHRLQQHSLLPLIALFLLTACAASPPSRVPPNPQENRSSAGVSSALVPAPWVAPLPLDRVTLKPFGIFVEPGRSPVSPERFRGYHTGADFEALPGETDVSVRAACSGPIVLKRWVSGYGGVVVERCDFNGSPVAVLYGHLRISSVTLLVGDTLTSGQSFAVLGKGGSTETDGEREHLHLAIHRGSAVELKGYVQKEAELSAWIDPLTVLR